MRAQARRRGLGPDGRPRADVAQGRELLDDVGGHPRDDYRATSLESLRSMVAAGGGATLLPALAAQPPVSASDAVVTRPIVQPVPSRDIALAENWRSS